jgi:hypothetical protein
MLAAIPRGFSGALQQHHTSCSRSLGGLEKPSYEEVGAKLGAAAEASALAPSSELDHLYLSQVGKSLSIRSQVK